MAINKQFLIIVARSSSTKSIFDNINLLDVPRSIYIRSFLPYIAKIYIIYVKYSWDFIVTSLFIASSHFSTQSCTGVKQYYRTKSWIWIMVFHSKRVCLVKLKFTLPSSTDIWFNTLGRRKRHFFFIVMRAKLV